MGDYNDPFMRNRDSNVQARTKAQNRATVLQLKLIGQSHPTGLTTNLLKLFEPRPPLEFKPPLEKRKCPPYTGIGQFVSNFAEPGDPEYAPPVQKAETSILVCHCILSRKDPSRKLVALSMDRIRVGSFEIRIRIRIRKNMLLIRPESKFG
ncbi:hypothetical protein Taro_016770 [Colocasia esculenta]|uniref:U1 small nuclear ribonucleoprotein of 70kDa N-terminal domain-containing protein n=1 Tax=Colocasia esculenta TaxID=4460 RepID=A0A843UXC3_COLES|nr:hypothetical protein [Colocasia esculenta]